MTPFVARDFYPYQHDGIPGYAKNAKKLQAMLMHTRQCQGMLGSAREDEVMLGCVVES